MATKTQDKTQQSAFRKYFDSVEYSIITFVAALQTYCLISFSTTPPDDGYCFIKPNMNLFHSGEEFVAIIDI